MSDIVIKTEGLGKQYRLGTVRQAYGTFRDVFDNIVGKTKDRITGKQQKATPYETIWALKDVNLEVKQGEVLGVIGPNGAGKSTLLKVLSQITMPTTGRAEVRGRVGSLLEVGTGFHQELTGRENIFLNGSILGMTRTEIQAKFDEIVAFAEIDKFLDTPVKRYSSGMFVRLAFAVAAHLEPEILFVDEVLAVGDVAFQKKCLGKMDSVSKTGRTVFFVSHNMGMINQLCSRAILMESGSISMEGPTTEITGAYYATSMKGDSLHNRFIGPLAKRLSIQSITVNNTELTSLSALEPADKVSIQVNGIAAENISNFILNIAIFREGVRLFTIEDLQEPKDLPSGEFVSEFNIPGNLLRPGEYSIAVGGYMNNGEEWFWGPNLAYFIINEQWSAENKQHTTGMINVTTEGSRTIKS